MPLPYRKGARGALADPVWLHFDGVAQHRFKGAACRSGRSACLCNDPVQEGLVSTGDRQRDDAGTFVGMQFPHPIGQPCNQIRTSLQNNRHLTILLDTPLPPEQRGDSGQEVSARGQPFRHHCGANPAGLFIRRSRDIDQGGCHRFNQHPTQRAGKRKATG